MTGTAFKGEVREVIDQTFKITDGVNSSRFWLPFSGYWTMIAAVIDRTREIESVTSNRCHAQTSGPRDHRRGELPSLVSAIAAVVAGFRRPRVYKVVGFAATGWHIPFMFPVLLCPAGRLVDLHRFRVGWKTYSGSFLLSRQIDVTTALASKWLSLRHKRARFVLRNRGTITVLIVPAFPPARVAVRRNRAPKPPATLLRLRRCAVHSCRSLLHRGSHEIQRL